MSTPFNKRAYGCAIIKVVNANYNADFTHQPRTLPDGTAYATDKALKYLVRNYWVNNYPDAPNHVLYYKRLNEAHRPFDLNEAYESQFPAIEKAKDGSHNAIVLKNLLSCLDVRLFGATFANKKKEVAISIHGPLQFTHGVNRYPESEIFSEQIMSPFRDDKEGKEDSNASTLGTQHKLARGHFVHHVSLNPSNLSAHFPTGKFDYPQVSERDVELIKEGLRRGATYYDSAAKAGIENELLLWVTLKEGAQVVLPSFVQLVEVGKDGVINLAKVSELLGKEQFEAAIEQVEIYYDHSLTQVINSPAGAKHHEIA